MIRHDGQYFAKFRASVRQHNIISVRLLFNQYFPSSLFIKDNENCMAQDQVAKFSTKSRVFGRTAEAALKLHSAKKVSPSKAPTPTKTHCTNPSQFSLTTRSPLESSIRPSSRCTIPHHAFSTTAASSLNNFINFINAAANAMYTSTTHPNHS